MNSLVLSGSTEVALSSDAVKVGENNGSAMIRPSSLPFLDQCPCFESGDESEFAEQGTVRHAALTHSLLDCVDPLLPLDSDEDREAIEWAANYIRTNAPTGHPLQCEVKRTWTGPDFSEREGTPDVTCGHVLFDFKWRRRNYEAQMADYALSIFDANPEFETVEVHVLYGAEKRAEKFFLTRDAAEAIVARVLAKANDPKREPSPCDYCGWCARRLTCSALLERANVVAEHRDDWGLESYHSGEMVTAEQLGKALRLARALKKWVEGVEYQCSKFAKDGVLPEGFKLQERRGNRFVSSVTEAFSRAGVAQEEFLKACEIGFGELVSLLQRTEELSKTAAEKEVERRLGDVVQRKSPSVSLVSVKEKA